MGRPDEERNQVSPKEEEIHMKGRLGRRGQQREPGRQSENGKNLSPAMNSLKSDLTFTVETVYDFKNRRLATLDFECEVIGNQVVYRYFQKPMKSPLVIGEASAMSDHQKSSILSNEVIRRMSNISDKISQAERVDIINKFTRELKSSGYTRRRAREIVVCGLLGLERKGKKRKKEGQSFHRKGKNTLQKRNLQKLNGKGSWFKNKPVDRDEEKQKKKENRERLDKEKKKQSAGDTEKKWGDPKAVMFIPYTPNSELAKELRKVEDMMEAMSGMRIKIVEKTGVQLKRILVKTNPWAGTDGLREDCLPCQTREETGEGKGKACHKGMSSMRHGVRHASLKMRKKPRLIGKIQRKSLSTNILERAQGAAN
jgi:hypothetical protein